LSCQEKRVVFLRQHGGGGTLPYNEKASFCSLFGIGGSELMCAMGAFDERGGESQI
jgi:hypothetical protein